MGKRVITIIGALVLVIGTLVSSVGAAPGTKRQNEADWGVDDINRNLRRADTQQHNEPGGHLPGQSSNVKRISRLKLTEVTSGIADLEVYKGYAYLNAWRPECPDAGTHIVDVRNPARPKKVGFLRAGAHDYNTEGAQAFTANTPKFKGDIYVVSHESCDDEGLGGISLWDVSNPRDPWRLASHFGDDTLTGPDFRADSHSAMGWADGNKAYVVAVDNLGLTESIFGLGGDVDIYDVTDPGAPVQIADFSLTYPAGLLDAAQSPVANGANSNHHDMDVRKIDRDGDGDKEWTLMLSYWDSGYIAMDVSDPASPTYIDDSDYPDPDPETTGLAGGPFTFEGNAHQGEWNHNGRLWLGTDEDFAPHRAQFTTDDPTPTTFDGSEFSWTPKVSETYEDGQINGPTVFGGLACDDPTTNDPATDSVPDAADYTAGTDEELILVMSRGGCFFSHKVDNAQDNGWDAAVVGQSHAGTLGGLNPDAFICGSQGHEFTPTIVALCTGHRAMHDFFDDAEEYPGTEGDDIAVGAEGDIVTARADIFDGWGYVNLYDARTLDLLDTFAPAPVHDPDCASDCGIMSVHEVATDRRAGKNLAYLSWYGLGLRVVRFSRTGGIQQRGVYMDIGGNDFWGVEIQHRGPNRRPLIYMADRDSGLWVFRYTGPE